MKEDILEQLVDDYLQEKGFFTRHNIKYRPDRGHPDYESRKDSNYSDIDVIGVHPHKTGCEGVYVVSCKSWQSGFNPNTYIQAIQQNKIVSGSAAWKGFRELVIPKWSEAFLNAIEKHTGTREFTYVLAVTKVNGDKKLWENHSPFINAIDGNPIKILDVNQIIEQLEEGSLIEIL